MELADVLFVLLVIANSQGIDMADALDGVLQKYRLRDSQRWTRKDGGGPDAPWPGEADVP